MNTTIRTTLVAAAVFVMCDHAAATTVTLSGQSFNEVSGPENLDPAFNQLGGQTTVNSYSGLVEVLVSGLGSNNVNDPTQGIDAFYQVNSSNQAVQLSNNSLRLGSQSEISAIPDGYSFVPNSDTQTNGSLSVANLAVVYDTASYSVPDPGPALDAFTALAPDYNPDHVYHFVMNLGSYSGTLTLGDGDGGVFDNSTNSYSISLWQLAPVPEPPGAVLLLIGGLAFGGAVLRQRKWRSRWVDRSV